ncbi:hypothetical protein [Streptosporangium sp. NPDC000396]
MSGVRRNSIATRRYAYKLLGSPGAVQAYAHWHDNDVPMVKAPAGALG